MFVFCVSVISFNPCYNGKGIIAIISQFLISVKKCFNPCYNGKGIIAPGTRKRDRAFFHRFNPCYNGKGIIASNLLKMMRSDLAFQSLL